MNVEIVISGTGDYDDEYSIPSFISDISSHMNELGFKRCSFSQCGVFQPKTDNEGNWTGVFLFEFEDDRPQTSKEYKDQY